MTIDEAIQEVIDNFPEPNELVKDEWRISSIACSVDGKYWTAKATRSCIPVWSTERTDWNSVAAGGKTPLEALQQLAKKLKSDDYFRF